MTPDQHTNQEFFLDVGDGHQLYAQDWGNKDAKTPILHIHGGPGAASHDGHKQFFDPEIHRVIFYDQRGAGKSLPTGSIDHNTTQDLIADIEKLLDHLRISQVALFGRSWGSTLALTYAIHHPHRVKAIVTGGVYLGSADEMTHEEHAAESFFPEVWQKFLQETPEAHHKNPMRYHMDQTLNAEPEAAKKSAYEYSSLVFPLMRLDDRPRHQDYETFDWQGIKLEAHYKQHTCFLAEDFILDNAHKITAPVWIVQGRYDIVCLPSIAAKLHSKLPKSELQWVVAGHSNSERATYDVTSAILRQIEHLDL